MHKMSESASCCWDNLFPYEFLEARRRANIAWVCAGTLEWHGTQSVLGCDTFIAYDACRRAAARLGGVVLPPIPFGPAGREDSARLKDRWRQDVCRGNGDFFIDYRIVKDFYREVLDQLLNYGFETVIAGGGHAPCAWAFREAADELRQRRPAAKIWGGCVVDFAIDALLTLIEDPGRFEASLLWAIDDRYVNLKNLERRDELYEYNLNHAHGRTETADKREGAEWMENMVAGFCETARRVMNAEALALTEPVVKYRAIPLFPVARLRERCADLTAIQLEVKNKPGYAWICVVNGTHFPQRIRLTFPSSVRKLRGLMYGEMTDCQVKDGRSQVEIDIGPLMFKSLQPDGPGFAVEAETTDNRL